MISPRRDIGGVQEALRGLRADYAAAQPSRFKRTRTKLGGPGDAHYGGNDLYKMREVSRDMDRNDPFIGQLFDRACDNILGEDLRIDFDVPRDPVLAVALNDAFWPWSTDPEQCDAAGEMTLDEMTWLSLRHESVDGDIWGLLHDDLTIQMVEADRIQTPLSLSRRSDLIHGVQINELRRRLRLWIASDALAARVRIKAEATQWDVRDEDGLRRVACLMSPKRFTYTRGVPALHPVMDTAGMSDDLHFAKLVQAQVTSAIAWFLKRTDPGGPPGMPAMGKGGETANDADGDLVRMDRVTPGEMLKLPPGTDVVFSSPNVPNPEYLPFARMLLQMISVNLGLPLVMGLMDASDTNFSGYRGAIDQARTGFKRRQRRMRERWIGPIVTWWVRRQASRGAFGRSGRALADGSLPWTYTLHLPGWRYIEPFKDAQADTLRIEKGLISPRRLHAENGADYDDFVNETAADNAQLILRLSQAAAEVNAADPTARVTWRDMLNPRGAAPQQQGAGRGAQGAGDAADRSGPEDDPEDGEDTMDTHARPAAAIRRAS